MIKQLDMVHAERSFNIIRAAVSDLKSKQIDQWDELYPTFDDIISDLEQCQAFGFFMDNHLVGYIALNQFNDPEYSTVAFKFSDNLALTVHRLTVDPVYQNKGIANKLMVFSESFAIKNKYTSIRLDAFSKNSKALKFYINSGYTEVGQICLRKGLFHVYEKPMMNSMNNDI